MTDIKTLLEFLWMIAFKIVVNEWILQSVNSQNWMKKERDGVGSMMTLSLWVTCDEHVSGTLRSNMKEMSFVISARIHSLNCTSGRDKKK